MLGQFSFLFFLAILDLLHKVNFILFGHFPIYDFSHRIMLFKNIQPYSFTTLWYLIQHIIKDVLLLRLQHSIKHNLYILYRVKIAILIFRCFANKWWLHLIAFQIFAWFFDEFITVLIFKQNQIIYIFLFDFVC